MRCSSHDPNSRFCSDSSSMSLFTHQAEFSHRACILEHWSQNCTVETYMIFWERSRCFSCFRKYRRDGTFHDSALTCCIQLRSSDMWTSSSISIVSLSITVPRRVIGSGGFFRIRTFIISLVLSLTFMWHWVACRSRSSVNSCIRLAVSVGTNSTTVVSSINFYVWSPLAVLPISMINVIVPR